MTTKANDNDVRMTWLFAYVAFSGDLDPDVDAAVRTLERAGYHVNRCPKKYLARVDVEGDDFIEVRVIGGEDEMGEFMDDVEAIVSEHGGCCPEVGPIDPGTPPFANGVY
jgi:hypothetical protein